MIDPVIQLEGLRSFQSIPAAFYDLARRDPEHVVYSQSLAVDKAPRPFASARYWPVAEKVSRLARYLTALGVAAGDRVAILSGTRPEWCVADMAILSAGGVSVSIYQTINRDETGYILFDSGATIVFAENAEQVTKLLSLTTDPAPIPATEMHPAQSVTIELTKILTFEKVDPHPLVIRMEDILNDGTIASTQPDSFGGITKDSLASLVYTSGTTGPPKGVMQTHGNHLANVWQAGRAGIFAPDGDIFLFLPLAHSFARLIYYIGFLTPTILRFPAITDTRRSVLDTGSLLKDLREASARCVPTVPRILEKMEASIKERATRSGFPAALLGATLRGAKEVYRARRDGRVPSLMAIILYLLTGGLRKKIRHGLFGRHFSHAVSGGAKLPVPTTEFFASLGIDVYEGYGLTETCVATNVNRLGNNKIGSVGPCFEEVQIRFTEEGEICFKGPNITKGYLNRPEATRAAWDEAGWFHTGDLGALDEEGFLFITGRKKDLIVTAGGKKVAPSAIEEKLVASRFVQHVVIVGDGKPYCSALIVPEGPTLEAWAKRKNIPFSLEHSEILSLYEHEISRVNEGLSKFETIKRFRLINEEFTVENGILTPTMKVKRSVVEKRYRELIDSIYQGGGGGD